jgi:seryl-tRNA synthetase
MTHRPLRIETPVAGVHLSTAKFQGVIARLRRLLLAKFGGDVALSLYAPPVVARSIIEMVGYQTSFPQLLAGVSLLGEDGEPVDGDVVLLPAACYGVYPVYAGTALSHQTKVNIEATCFRAERSSETGRLRSFQMWEIVTLGTANYCLQWRDHSIEMIRTWFEDMGLSPGVSIASDPFFGTGDRLMKSLQLSERLKIEVTANVTDHQRQAVASGNYHKDHFGRIFDIRGPDGNLAHTACIAFGFERLAMAVIDRHGPDTESWPST